MNENEIIFQQASIIEQAGECFRQLAELTKDALSLLAQYQAVEEEERRYSEIMKLSTFSNKEAMTNE